MTWKFDDDSPIYLQIVEHVKSDIAAGRYKSGDRLPPVREMAVDAGVNPNTMQKALAELERQGILCSRRTSGRFVSDSVQQGELLMEQAGKFMKEFTENMQNIGFKRGQIQELYREYLSLEKPEDNDEEQEAKK